MITEWGVLGAVCLVGLFGIAKPGAELEHWWDGGFPQNLQVQHPPPPLSRRLPRIPGADIVHVRKEPQGTNKTWARHFGLFCRKVQISPLVTLLLHGTTS
jgi:hypothetical protein